MQYFPPYGSNDPNASYVNGNPATGTTGSIPNALAFEYQMREIVNAITAAGLTPSNGDLTQLLQAIKLLGRVPLIADQGSANMIVVNPSPAWTAYTAPITLEIIVAALNTGATTINVSGLGAIPLINGDGSALSAGQLPANAEILVGFDNSGHFVLLSVTSPGGSGGSAGVSNLFHYGVDSSVTANTVTATTDTLGSSWPSPLLFAIKIANNNTGASTVNLNGLGALNIVKDVSTALAANDMIAGKKSLFLYDSVAGTAQLLNPASAGGGALPAMGYGQARIITTSGAFTMLSTDGSVALARSSSPAVSNTTLYAQTTVGWVQKIHDLVGNFNKYPVTVTAPASCNIAGENSVILNVDRSCHIFEYFGSNTFGWSKS